MGDYLLAGWAAGFPLAERVAGCPGIGAVGYLFAEETCCPFAGTEAAAVCYLCFVAVGRTGFAFFSGRHYQALSN